MGYKLVKKLSQGGMAEIFLASKHNRKGNLKLWCIKRILPHYVDDDEFAKMFRDEFRITKRFVHPNLIAIKEYVFIDEAPAIVMEFVPGTDIRDILVACERTKKRLTVPMACFLIAQAARGLNYVHKLKNEQGQPLSIVHRDISPQNILVSFRGAVKVIDFGIADTNAKLNVTKPGVIKGKFSYMSPEQVGMKEVDSRTDIFALGVVLWEMLAMRKLFQGANEIQTIELVQQCTIRKNIQDLNKDVNDNLAGIFHKVLAKDPGERYASGKEFDDDLCAHIKKYYPGFSQKELVKFLRTLMEKKYRKIKEHIHLASKDEEKRKKASPSSDLPESTFSNSVLFQSSVSSSSSKKKTTSTSWDKDFEKSVYKSQDPVFEKSKISNMDEPKIDEAIIDRELSLVTTLDDAMTSGSANYTHLRLPSANNPNSSLNVRGYVKNEVYTPSKKKATKAAAAIKKKVNKKKLQTSMAITLVGLAAAAALFVILSLFNDLPSSSNATVTVDNNTIFTVKTFPSSAKIALNGKPLSKYYIQSPYALPRHKLADGRNILRVSRAGFETENYAFHRDKLDSLREIDISLKPKSDLGVLLLVSHPNSKIRTVDYSFGEKLAVGSLSPNKDARVTFLQPGRNYVVNFTAKDMQFRCNLASSPSKKKVTYLIYPEIEACVPKTK
ncbi:MAG: serine/threonine-protein kinase [Proteobacteria bacterium]|nr:serine/threonine-protein kinase [Pseudomonadota bacterium]